ncbi:MAG TPA: endonuclease [Chitinophagaceae bacterium]
MKARFLLLLLLLPILLFAQPPAGYYNTASGLSCAPLKTALKNIITAGHVNQGYSALWTQFQVSDLKPREVGTGSAMVIWDIYSDNPVGTDPYNFTPGTGTGGQQDQGSGGTSEGQYYNREHTVPLSWHSGSTSSFSGSDYHHVFPTDKKVNSERANWPYGKVATASWTSMNGSKLGSSAIAGITGTVFEPIDEYKGDVARAFFYFITRYEDDMPAWGLNADAAQAFEPNTFPSADIPYLRMMIQWHNLDPVSQKEIDRNNAAYTYQGNRNPYVDYPQYVGQVWSSTCPGLGALPVDITMFTGVLESQQIMLDWEVGTEINLEKYEVERSFNGNDYLGIASVPATGKTRYRYTDNVADYSGRRVFYRIKKLDKDGKYSYSAVFSIHIPLNLKFSVYPNPVSDIIRINISAGNGEPIELVLSDLTGKTILRRQAKQTASVITLPVAGIAPGTYIMKAVAGGQVFMQKLVITR